MSDVKVLKLITGEEIVSKVSDEGSFFKLENPVKFVMVPMQGSKVGVEMHPFIMLSKDTEFELPKDKVMLVAEPIEDIVSSYNNQFSDLILPPEPTIIT